MDAIKKELQTFPSHFILEGMETLSVPKMRSMKERILEGIQSDLEPDCHEMARDRNLLLFLDYKLSDPTESSSVIEEMKERNKNYQKDMIALANLAWIYVETNDCEEAEECVKCLGYLEVWSQVYADAELAYTYVRMGPRFCRKGRDLFEKVIDFRSHYPGPSKDPPRCIDKLKVVWSYGIILANQRILNPCVFGEIKNFDRGQNGDPEKIIRRSCALLEKVVSSEFDYYVAHAWLNLRKSFISYKNIGPKKCRKLKIKRLTGGFTLDDCLEKAVQANMGDCHALLTIGTAYRKWPLNDLIRSELFLQRALNSLDKNPGVYHQLALLSVDKWLVDEYGIGTFRSVSENKKSSQKNPLLAEAIGYLQEAIKHNHEMSILFHIDLVRCKFSYAAEDEREDVLATINQLHLAIRKYGAPKSDQAYAFLHVGLIHEAFGNLKKCRNFLEQSVQMAIDSRTRSYAFPILEFMIRKDCRENPGVEAYNMQAQLYEMVHQYQPAIESYEKIRELGDRSPAILEKLAENLYRERQYMDASQCLKLLLSQESDQFQTGESRGQFIDVCLLAASQYMDDNERAAAANIYQELITDMMPRDVPPAYSKVVVLSSEERNDHTKTESLINLLGEDLGFNEDSCKWPYKNVEGFEKDYNQFIFGYIKKTWCCVVHLTDVLLQDNVFMTTVLGKVQITS